MAVPEPITRLEKYWAAILDKIQGGGSAPVLEALEVSANGTYTPEEGVDGFDRVIVGVEQEWYSFTVTGTLDAPFASDDFIEMVDADELYGSMTIDATAIGSGRKTVPFMAAVPSTGFTEIFFSACVIPSTTVSDVEAADIGIVVDLENQTVQLDHANLMQQGAIVDLSQYASLIPTTTTFVYHIPSSND